ncbi:MAG: DNA translocase FtsK 4TM domain-containing protein, partial [Candidatus Sungiibacteriota bacterium]
LLLLSYVGKGGMAGAMLFRFLDFLLGKGYFFAPIMLLLVGFSFLFSHERKLIKETAIGGALFLIFSLGIFNILFGVGNGGALGATVSYPLLGLFDFWAGLLIAVGFLVASLFLVFNIPLLWQRIRADDNDEQDAVEQIPIMPEVAVSAEEPPSLLARASALISSRSDANAASTEQTSFLMEMVEDADVLAPPKQSAMRRVKYKRPPFDLLQGDKGTPSSGDIRANANVIKRTLENFGIMVEMGEVAIGPTVTQYTLRPAEGVKLSRIMGLNNDLSLALAAHPLRIEAPIPGKSLVGIEVPNRSISLVGLRALIENKSFQDAPHPLMISLGRDVAGAPVYADIAKMPHLLISGSTGSGKSVNIHTLVTSLLYRNSPDALRFIFVDPKRVELSIYNDIPHLLTPVITDAKKTIQALRWAAKEMDRRYDLLSLSHARDIISYNTQIIKKPDVEPLPYIIIIIDELADLMSVYPREMEASIVRLAQMARAVGIHLVVATQRPSVEVITGLIKANITSRIAFQVASQIDSRTILDGAGAEKLLGNGDMLFLAGDTGRPRRLQGAYVSEQEVKRVVEFLRDSLPVAEHDEDIFSAKAETGEGSDMDDSDAGDDDVLYEEAHALVMEADKASASYLQRRLRIGYARAARLLDLMEQRGVIGPADGAKPREVFEKSGGGVGIDDDMV